MYTTLRKITKKVSKKKLRNGAMKMSVAVAQSIETGFIPHDFAAVPQVQVVYERTVAGWFTISFPRFKRKVFTLSPDVVELVGIDGKYTLGCVSMSVDMLYDLFVRGLIDKDGVYVHVSKFDLIAWYAVFGCKLDEAEEYRQLIADVIEIKK
jgi:hypothetical protein